MSLSTSPKHQIAWAAGLFEGEGCLTYSSRKIGATIVTTDRDVLDRFVGIVGLGRIESSARKPRPSSFAKKDQWVWKATSHQSVQAIVAAFWDFLGERRRGRAIEILRATANTPRATKYRTPKYNGNKCRRGHDMSGDNLYINPSSGREFCRACLKADQRARYVRLRSPDVKPRWA